MPCASGKYSPLEHLGRSVLGLRYSNETLFTMLTSYFDEGYKDGLFMCVCGWASTVEQWDGFEADWKLFLNSYHVPYFHMEEYSQSVGPFKKWKGLKAIRQKFCADAAEIICSRVKRGFIFYVRQAPFNTVNALFAVDEIWGSPYGMAGRCCMELADRWRNDNFKLEEMEYVFEDGGPDKGGLIKAMTAVEPFFPVPEFKPGRDWKKSEKWPNGRVGMVQLQAADYLAYESRRAMDDRFLKRLPAKRKSLQAILANHVDMGALRDMRLAKFCYRNNVRRRLPAESAIYDTFKP
jgi:hypothetical protein